MATCKLRIIHPAATTVEKVLELEIINDGWLAVFEHLDQVSPNAVLEFQDHLGARVISVCAGTASEVRSLVSARPRASNERNLVPI